MPVAVAIEQMQLTPLDEDAEVRVTDLRRQTLQPRFAQLVDFRVTQHDQLRADVLRQHLLSDGMTNHSSSKIKLADRGTAPIDDLRRQHTADTQFLTNSGQQKIQSRTVDFGDRKSTRLNSSHSRASRMPSSA